MDLQALITKAEAIIASTVESIPEGTTRAAFARGEGADEKMSTFILLTKAAKSAYDDGHSDGYTEGNREGYDSGYSDGYDQGYSTASTGAGQ